MMAAYLLKHTMGRMRPTGRRLEPITYLEGRTGRPTMMCQDQEYQHSSIDSRAGGLFDHGLTCRF